MARTTDSHASRDSHVGSLHERSVKVASRLTARGLFPGGGGGGGDSHLKWTGMLVVSLRSVNFGFWSRLGCSG